MGACDFDTYAEGTDPKEAFREAREAAEYEYGAGGYTGSIAEKDTFVVLHATPVPLGQAMEMAGDMLERGLKGVDDKWGPAGAIAVAGGRRVIEVKITERPGGYRDKEEAARESLAAQGLLEEGAEVAYGIAGSYTTSRSGRVMAGTLHVPVTGGTSLTGWLFFGMASE